MRNGKKSRARLREEKTPLDMLKKKYFAPDEDMKAAAAEPEEIPETQEETEADPLQQELDAARAQAEEYLNMAQRVQADFDNFRRRNASVRADAYEDGAKDMIKLILPVIDNLERALESESTDEKLLEGVKMTYKQMMDVLEKKGVTVIDRQGEAFDPNLENAVMRAPKEMGEPGTVSQVFQKGYKMGDSVLRFAMVQVVEE